MVLQLVDSHCHLDALDDLVPQLAEANQQGVRQFVLPGTRPQQWQDSTALGREGIHLALGTHPWYVSNPEHEIRQLEEYLARFSVVAVGEIGLDFLKRSYPLPDKKTQLHSFELQLDLARKHNLPVIIHAVKSHNEVLALLGNFPSVSGVVHAYSGSLEVAEKYIRQGFYLGAGPIILKSKKTARAFQHLPINHILLETDAPYMKVSIEQTANPLLDLLSVATHLADLKEMPVSEVAQVTSQNASRLFRI